MVLVGVLVLAALPAALSAVPAQQSGISADELLLRLAHSGATPFSGYAEASGGLALPVTRQFSSVADLFGGKTQLRAWTRGVNDWRIDTIGFAGETDVHASRQGTWTWDYEAGNASWTGAGGPSRYGCPPPVTCCRRTSPAGCSARRARTRSAA